MPKIKNWSKVKDSKLTEPEDNRVKLWKHDKYGDQVSIRKTPRDINPKYIVQSSSVGGTIGIAEGDNLSALETKAVKWMQKHPNSI